MLLTKLDSYCESPVFLFVVFLIISTIDIFSLRFPEWKLDICCTGVLFPPEVGRNRKAEGIDCALPGRPWHRRMIGATGNVIWLFLLPRMTGCIHLGFYARSKQVMAWKKISFEQCIISSGERKRGRDQWVSRVCVRVVSAGVIPRLNIYTGV